MRWPLVNICEVTTINPRLPKGIDEAQKVSFVGMASASEEGNLISEETRVLSETRKGFTYFEKGDVLLAKITPCFENGKSLRPNQITNQVGFGSTEFHVLRPIPGKVDGLYLFYMIWSDKFRWLGENSMSGAAGQKRVSTDFLKGFEIPLPPLKEQKRIAAIFDKADNLRRKRQQAIALADEFLRAVFHDMTLNSRLSVDLSSSNLGDLCTVVRGSSPRPAGDPRYYGGDVPRLMVRDLTRDGKNVTPKIDFLTEEGAKKSRPMKAGDMVVAVSGQPGMPAILNVDACIHDGFAGLRNLDASRVDANYLYYYLITIKDSNADSAVGAIFKNLNTDQLKNLHIPLPSIARQREISDVLSKAERIKSKNIINLNNMSSLFTSISQKSFSCELGQ